MARSFESRIETLERLFDVRRDPLCVWIDRYGSDVDQDTLVVGGVSFPRAAGESDDEFEARAIAAAYPHEDYPNNLVVLGWALRSGTGRT